MSFTVAARLVAKEVFTVADWGVPPVAAIEAGGPALFVIAKPGLVLRALAVPFTVYLPDFVFALNTWDVAMPLELVTAVFPQAKVPLAPLVGGLKVTSTPDTGLEEASSTVATRGLAKFLLTVALCGVPPVAVMVAGTCGSETVRVIGTIISMVLLGYSK
jgi:hypothetical protein